jgi:3'(2'), 5'-bisphosphate nucleotidase
MKHRLARVRNVPTPLPPIDRNEVAGALLEAGLEGARELMALRPGCAVSIKPDASPVCAADLSSDETIRRALRLSLPGIGIVSEEHPDGWHDGAGDAARFLIVDPLDGTREYLAGLSEFTVNLALIEHGRPVAACIIAPASGEAWTAVGAAPGVTAWQLDAALATATPIGTAGIAEPGARPLRIVVSRSHGTAADRAFGDLSAGAEIVPGGSALKFVKVATGIADAYPRRQPTMQWDTAAGDLLVHAAGGAVLAADGHPIRYGAAGAHLNGPFIAACSIALAQDLLAYWPI